MASTDCLQLNKSTMFAKIRDGLPVDRSHTQDLVECKDDVLFCWDSRESCLLTLNWRLAMTAGLDQVKYQTLSPSLPFTFDVERIVASIEGSLIALAGPRGLCVMEMPRRWGAGGQYMDGKSKIICRTSNLDAHFFTNNPHIEIRQLRWHPASPTDSHLLVLLSDNTIRVYDNASLRHVWQVGPLQLKGDGNPNSSTVFALGETAVDFDIAPAVNVAEMQVNTTNTVISKDQTVLLNSTRLNQNTNRTVINETKSNVPKQEKIEWPIVILRENGNIYVLMAGLDTERPRLQGPITITPACTDNYGLDSCSILVIPSLPPTLVIAETNGKLHHALLLEAEEAEDSFNEVDDSLIIHPSEWVVHVLETVELELGLPKDEINQPYFCPIHLKRDFINELRYFAYHNTGLHVITVNFIGELQRFLENEVNSDIASLSTPSHAEYIVCTKIDHGDNVNPVLGFVLLQMPSCIVLLLASGQVISLKLVIDAKLLADPHTRANDEDAMLAKKRGETLALSQLNQILAPSFVDHMKGMFKRSVTQPILSLDKKSNPTPQECYELLTQAIEVLRSQYLKRHEAVRNEFVKRIHTIKLCKEQQRQDIKDLERERELIRDKAHKLAEKFEEISDHQEVLTKRCQDLVRQANTCLPSNSLAEKDFAQEVERINKLTKNMTNSLLKCKEAINKQNYHIAKYHENSKKKAFELPDTQERTIKEILLQMTAEIDGQIKEVKHISKAVGI